MLSVKNRTRQARIGGNINFPALMVEAKRNKVAGPIPPRFPIDFPNLCCPQPVETLFRSCKRSSTFGVSISGVDQEASQTGALGRQRCAFVSVKVQREAQLFADRPDWGSFNYKTLYAKLSSKCQQERLIIGSKLLEALKADFEPTEAARLHEQTSARLALRGYE